MHQAQRCVRCTFKGSFSVSSIYQKGNLIRIKTGLDTYLIRIQTRTPLSRYPPYDYSKIEFRGILGAAVGVQKMILGMRNSTLGMASRDLSKTQKTVPGRVRVNFAQNRGHEKATTKPRKSHEKGPNTAFLDRRGPRKSHEKAMQNENHNSRSNSRRDSRNWWEPT